VSEVADAADPSVFTLAGAGSIYTIGGTFYVNTPSFTFPTTLTSADYGTYWTITNTRANSGQEFTITGGIYKLTIPGAVLTRNGTDLIRLVTTQGSSITFVFFAGSGSTAEYIAF
jgi:hypothetical protein